MDEELILKVIKNKRNGQLNLSLPKNKIKFMPENPKKIKLKVLELFE